MTPSGWHDDASGRDAGHDEMQIAVFDWLRDKDPRPVRFVEDGGSPFSRTGVYFEMPICNGGRVVAWGDAAEIWDREKGNKTERVVRIFEIKPRIYSVGAVVRQCVALEITAKDALRNPREFWHPDVIVWPVVKSDDPKLPLLRHVYCAMAWDGSALS